MMTKAEAKQIDDLLTELNRLVGMNAVKAVARARQTIARNTEGQVLPRQLAHARADKQLPRCLHGRFLMDWSGEALVPPCGCRMVEPDDGGATKP